MSLALGTRLRIRATVYLAGEAIPFFWPMRTFIYHNPLYGMEHLAFAEAVEKGERFFQARGFLPRAVYQRYLAAGKIDTRVLAEGVARFLADRPALARFDTQRLLMTLLTDVRHPLPAAGNLVDAADLHAALQGRAPGAPTLAPADLAARVHATLSPARPAYLNMDALFGTHIADTLDELVIKSCLDFFDEGQSAWRMPGREQGLFKAWSALARHNLRLSIRGLHIKRMLSEDDTPEAVISRVMQELGVPESAWIEYFSRSLTRLRGWAGFVRWRSGAKHYYWSQIYPADLVDFLALRMVLGLALMREHAERLKLPLGVDALTRFVDAQPTEAYLRHELYSGSVLPEMAQAVEDAVVSRKPRRIETLLPDYLRRRRSRDTQTEADALRALATRAGLAEALRRLDVQAISVLRDTLAQFERCEGPIWLAAHEAHYMGRLVSGLSLDPPAPREKRPFAQIMFCIDVRSERIRRHLEQLGDYETFGIAGFFGVPVGFIGLDKGSEVHLCPVVVTPKNLVLELDITRHAADEDFVSVLEHVLHDLKASVLSPFITVEAIGLLFGLDMVGKTLAPLAYNRWRARLFKEKPASRLLVDKISLEQADSVIRSLQRALIVRALERELRIHREAVTDDMIRELREVALGHQETAGEFARHFRLGEKAERDFVECLRTRYRINRHYARMQLERLGRIGFTLDEQVNYVHQALRSIGLTQGFSRFVLLAGHGSTSENNPYESALDCGACGGNHGATNARVLSQMANKAEVRERLRSKGIQIPSDTWFVPAFHNTTTDKLDLHDLDLLPPGHLIYTERLINGLKAASRLCASERMVTLDLPGGADDPVRAYRNASRNANDWSQVRPEWGLSGNAAFVIGRRHVTQQMDLEGRVFMQSYDYQCDRKGRLLENILSGPLVVGQWINMDYYFSTVDNDHYGSGSKVYHNVAGHFGVMTGNLSDLRTGLPAQTVLKDGMPYHEPVRLLTIIEAPLEHARRAIWGIPNVRTLVRNGWVRMAILDPEARRLYLYEDGEWQDRSPAHFAATAHQPAVMEVTA